MRGTLHLVSAEDVRWILNLLSPRVIKSRARRYRQLKLQETDFTKSRVILEKKMQENRGLTRSEPYEVLEEAGISTGGQRGYHIVSYLGLKGVICWGPRRDRQHTFVLLDEWVGSGEIKDYEEALYELAKRYIQSHGPATEYDFASWSGLTVTTSRKALKTTEDLFEIVKTDDNTYWMAPPISDSVSSDNKIYLLPGFDEIICGYKDLSALLDSDYQKSNIVKNGIIKPVVVAGNKIRGIWERTLRSGGIEIEIDYFDEYQPGEGSLHKAAKEYASFFGKNIISKTGAG